ncbi:MAG: phosphoenolpyruvate--protein phosphotransferase [Oscillospiraceae bacterium]|nr:phosphoenolpyruvate--protein phosphotransferase [Oscillospiraceae bacterium]
MKKGIGLPVFSGVAIGPAVVYRKAQRTLPVPSGDPALEKAKFEAALETARQQLTALYEKAKVEIGEEQAAIVEVQLLMLDDLDYLDGVNLAIEGGAAAAIAALDTGEEFAQIFAAMDDEYMNARSADIRDMSHRLYDILCGNTGFQLPEGSFLLVAEDLAPSETIQLPRERILAFVTQQGSSSSHTAILARTLNIPSLVQSDITFEDAENCKVLAVDGTTGTWYADPDEETLAMLRVKQAEAAAARNALEAYRGKESVTRSGKKVLLVANIGCPEDAIDAIKADAEGVGLMRSEFLYLGRDTLPTEDELYEAYKKVAEIMGHRPVVIRTLDIGADKQVSYMGLEKEENPALGLRGLRICLTREEIFRPQLRAIFRASAYGNLHVMFPMVASVWELKAAKALCAKIRMELEAEGYPTKDVPIGVMVETPAAAVLAHELAKEADFFSVGTNDLTQYTLAVDRQNAKLGQFYDPYHPALLALMAHIAKAAKDNGIWAGICGELGADPKLQEKFIEMGYTELSMAAGRILESRKLVCESQV